MPGKLSSAEKNNLSLFLLGLKESFPVAMGYLAVSFALGITAAGAGLNALQGFVMSLLNNASAGEYAAIQVIASGGAYIQIALITLITNLRYLLMSASLSQKISPKTPFFHRFFIAYDITDELFGLMISRPSYLEPAYAYGTFILPLAAWAGGTALGITAGDLLPARALSALGVALFGMFISIIITPAKKNKVIAITVLISFASGALTYYLPAFKKLFDFSGGDGIRIIILTVIIAGAMAFIRPIKEEKEEESL